MDDLPDLGLFPLDLVVLPGERLPLHLFEPRYRRLYADCAPDDRPFVVLRQDASGTAAVGCATLFDTLLRRFEDGRMNVLTHGVEPVEVVEETGGRPYPSARVRVLADAPGGDDPALAEEVLGRFRRLGGLADDALPAAAGEVPLSYAVASAIDLPADPKQELLEAREEPARLRMLGDLLAGAERRAGHARTAAERASANGRVTTP